MFQRLLALAAKSQATSLRRGGSRESCSSVEQSISNECNDTNVANDDLSAAERMRNFLRPRGKAHSQSVAIGIARKKLQRATSTLDMTESWRLRVVSVGFSAWSRGRSSGHRRESSLDFSHLSGFGFCVGCLRNAVAKTHSIVSYH